MIRMIKERMIKRIASACYFHAYGIINIIWNLILQIKMA